MPETERQAVAAEMLEQQLATAKLGLSALSCLVVPAVRQSVHDLAERALRELVDALADVADVARHKFLAPQTAEEAAERHAAGMMLIDQLGQEIQRIRVLEHAVE